jgi:uncharacterized protein (TIGR03435 family)
MRAAATLFLILSTALAQAPQFEVASVKPSPPGATSGAMSGGPGTKDPGLFTCQNISLRALMVTAYNLLTYRFSGPDWMGAARFNISAKIPEGTTREQFQAMLQNLLLDRFEMTVHWEKKEIQTYDLVVGKGGAKLKESTPEADVTETTAAAGPPKADTDGFPILPPGRHRALLEIGSHVAMRWSDEAMGQFVTYLAAQLRTPVHDETGLKGQYDFTLRWVSDGATPSADETAPYLFRAVQEQLGLRLESKKGTIDILVVDRAEKTPTEN